MVVSKDNQDGFNKLRESYNLNKSPEGLYALMLCSTNNMMRYNKSFNYNQTFGKRSYNSSTEKKLNEFVKYISNYSEKIIFSSENFNKINITKPSMVYIDPPYTSVQDKNGNISKRKISEAGYNNFYTTEDDINLYNYILNLDKNNHSFMLSGLLEHDGKQSWIMNKLIKSGFNYKELSFNYNGVSRKKNNKNSKEIIIINY